MFESQYILETGCEKTKRDLEKHLNIDFRSLHFYTEESESFEFRVRLQEKTPAKNRLYWGEGDLAVRISDLLLSDGVARHSGHQGWLLLRLSISDGEGNNIDTTRNVLQLWVSHPEKVGNKLSGKMCA